MQDFLKDFGKSPLAGLKRTFDFNGTASKREFWFFLLFFLVAYPVVWVVDDVFLTNTVNLKKPPFGELLPGG